MYEKLPPQAAATEPTGTCATMEAVVLHMLREYMPVLR